MKGVRRVAELIGDHIGYPAHLAGAAHGLPRPAGESAPPLPSPPLLSEICELRQQAQLYPLTYGAELTQKPIRQILAGP